MSEFLMRRLCPRLNVKNYSAHCEVSCLQHVHGFQWLNSGHQLGQANTISCWAISSALFFFFLLSLHEEIKQIHILTNNREENYNQRQKITQRIRRIMEVCLQFNCYTHCIILGVTCALHKHKKPWNMENKHLPGDLRRIFLFHIYTNRIPQVLEHRLLRREWWNVGNTESIKL